MPRVLTAASRVDCGHGGAVAVTGEPKLRVGGSPVLLRAGIQGKAVGATCALTDTADASGTPTTLKCRAVTSVSAGEAIKLKAGGAPVMLDTLAGGTDGMATKGVLETKLTGAGQTKLRAS